MVLFLLVRGVPQQKKQANKQAREHMSANIYGVTIVVAVVVVVVVVVDG